MVVAPATHSIQTLMQIAAPARDLDWLKASLQEAIKLEFATLPPYLCALWSIKDPEDPVYESVSEHIAEEEMLHMGLACNLLVAIGGQPQLNQPEAVPTYPGPLPGGVLPGVEVALNRLSPASVKVFLQIEYPETGPLDLPEFAQATRTRSKTIGEFYTAIEAAFHQLRPPLDPSKQLERAFDPEEGRGIFIIQTLADVSDAIELIKRQGEGSTASPADTGPEDLAHFYRFLEIDRGRKIEIINETTGEFGFSDQPVPFPDVYPMATIPAGGYLQTQVSEAVWELIAQFDQTYSEMLLHLQRAWDGEPNQLRAAVGAMFNLAEPARALMNIPIPGRNGETYGPCFRLVPVIDPGGGSGGPSEPVEQPTWENDIQGLFNDGDVACMRRRGLDLSNYQDVRVNAAGILDSVERGFMPPGDPWPASWVTTFRNWIETGMPRGGSPAGEERPGWNPTSAPEAGSRYDDIWFITPRLGWAVNSEGQILHTNDGAATWVQQFRTPMIGTRAVYLRCISFANEQRGWCGTLTDSYRMFETRDGGTNWTLVTNLPDNAPLAICGLYAVSESVIYASGTNFPYQRYPTGVIKSSDGGATWIGIDMGAYASNLIDIFFFDEQRGFVVGGYSDKADPDYVDVTPVVMATEDGGQTWENRVADLTFEPGEWGWKINFVNERVGYVSLESFDRGAILKTIDGGQTWTRYPINDAQGNANLEGIGFITEDRGWVGGWGDANFTGGYTSGTTDGGRNWVDANEVGRFINRFRFLGSPVTVGYAGGRRIYKYNPEGDPAVADSAATLVPTASVLQTAQIERFTNTAAIEIKVPSGAQHAWINIWNRFGLEVRVLLDEANPMAGDRTITWDGLDHDGQPVPDGIYIFRVTIDNTAESGCFYLLSP